MYTPDNSHICIHVLRILALGSSHVNYYTAVMEHTDTNFFTILVRLISPNTHIAYRLTQKENDAYTVNGVNRIEVTNH
jgi:hypothetical protein